MKPKKKKYTPVVTNRVVANIFFACVQGPYKKHVLQMLIMFPMLYMSAKGLGFPANSWMIRVNDPNDSTNPSTMKNKAPPILCWYVI